MSVAIDINLFKIKGRTECHAKWKNNMDTYNVVYFMCLQRSST